MKKLIFAIGILGLFVLSSCNPDLNDLDAVSTIDNIKGKWHAVRYDGDVNTEYEVEITADPDNANGILITNFFNNGETANANVVGKTISVPAQDLGGYQVEGTGTISDDYQKISWQLTVDGENVSMDFTPGTVTKFQLQ